MTDSGWLTADNWKERAESLKNEGWMLTDLCGVDRLGLGGETRFEIAIQLLHMTNKERKTLHVYAQGDPPSIPSVVSVWPTSDFMEREAYDMFGIEFEGHPNLVRILMPEEWEGHPLRRDYGVGKVTVEFAPQPFLQIDAPGQAPGTAEAGRDVDRLGQSGRPMKELGNAPGADARKGKPT